MRKEFKAFVFFGVMLFFYLLAFAWPALAVKEGQTGDVTKMGGESPWAYSSGGTVFSKYDSSGNLKTVISGLTSISVDISGGTLASTVTVLNPVTSVSVTEITAPVTIANPVTSVAVSGITNTVPVSGIVKIGSGSSTVTVNGTVTVNEISNPVSISNPVNTVAVSGITNPVTVSGTVIVTQVNNPVMVQGQISGITTVGAVTSITNPITVIPSGNISGITAPITVLGSVSVSGITTPVSISNPVYSVAVSGITNPVTILASASGVTVNMMDYVFDAGTTVVNKIETEARKYGTIISDIHDVRIQQGRSWRIESVELNLGSGATKAYAIITSGATVETWLKVVIEPTYKTRYRVYNQPIFTSGTTLTAASNNPHMQAIGASTPVTKWYENPVCSDIGTKVKGEIWGTESTQQTPSSAHEQVVPWRILSVNQTLLFEFYSYYADNNINVHFYFEEVQGGVSE